MDKGFKLILLSLLLLFIALLLQSTFFELLKIHNIKPDVSLIVLIFIATRKGVMPGQICGFFLGLLQAFFSGMATGFYAITKTIIGFVFGLTQGTLSVSSVVVPFLLAGAATIMKGIVSGLVHIIFAIPAPDMWIFILNVSIETVYNAVLAPFIFLLLGKIKFLKPEKSEVY
jgi:rod shape-determining protein MreD